MRAMVLIGLMASIIPCAIAGDKLAIDLTSYRLASDGLGPIKIGMSSVQVAQAGISLGRPKYGNKDCDEYPLVGNKGVDLLFQDNRLTKITVTTFGIRTLSGAHVGMPAKQVERIYGAKLEVLHFADVGEEGGGGTMRIYSSDRKSSVVFGTNEDQVNGTRQQPVVTFIRSGPAADDYESCF